MREVTLEKLQLPLVNHEKYRNDGDWAKKADEGEESLRT